jgi:KaiC/GvpD/RAD55 family RecA-like ATPase
MLALSEMSFKVARGQATLADFTSLYDKLKKDDHNEVSLQCVSSNLEELLNDVYSEQGFRWRLNCLNKSLGSLRKGDFGFIFARPETGKTTFLISEISNFLEQGCPKIVLFNNEEEGRKVFLRLYQGFFGVGLDKLLSNTKLYSDEFNKRTGGQFTLIDSAGTGRREIERVVQRLEPEIVVYDQIDKIKGFANDREDLRLGSIYQWTRELAKGNHAAIGVFQADGTAEGIRYLTMDHVSNAKTAKQAEADWILGIGKTHREEDEFVRFLNISKNKLFGDKDSNPTLKHGKFEVGIQPAIARYKDIVNYE